MMSGVVFITTILVKILMGCLFEVCTVVKINYKFLPNDRVGDSE